MPKDTPTDTPTERPEPSDEEKLAAAVILARSILTGVEVRIPIETQLRGLAQTVLYLAGEE